MTINNKINIRIMREAGCSYNQIARLLKMPKSTVATHCQKYGIKPNNHQSANNTGTTPLFHLCEECGELFIAKTKRAQKYCSGKCRVAAWRRKQEEASVSNEILDFLGETSDRYRGENSNQPLIIGVRKVVT